MQPLEGRQKVHAKRVNVLLVVSANPENRVVISVAGRNGLNAFGVDFNPANYVFICHAGRESKTDFSVTKNGKRNFSYCGERMLGAGYGFLSICLKKVDFEKGVESV